MVNFPNIFCSQFHCRDSRYKVRGETVYFLNCRERKNRIEILTLDKVHSLTDIEKGWCKKIVPGRNYQVIDAMILQNDTFLLYLETIIGFRETKLHCWLAYRSLYYSAVVLIQVHSYIYSRKWVTSNTQRFF